MKGLMYKCVPVLKGLIYKICIVTSSSGQPTLPGDTNTRHFPHKFSFTILLSGKKK
ncbi:hypothetical protein E2C01_048244 [Portunus trituberculatus]|uniref:Uncharacterized protein n=1 Tax=Portunus trituberculatus TaxID=210409 RepID=A0A5B7GCS5_PORTR|nr:hypothetical protein [Portunus trituberculatus]